MGLNTLTLQRVVINKEGATMYARQRGFTLLGLMITMGFISAIFLSMAENLVVRQLKAQAEPFEKRMLYIKDQIDAYQLTQFQANANNINLSLLFPRTLNALSPDYIPTCKVKDNQKGLCELIDQLPWGDGSQKIQYQVKRTTGITPAYYYAEITLPLPSKSDDSSIREYNVYTEVLSRLPGIRFSPDEQSLIWRINRLGNIPAFEALMSEYVKKDGTTPLTADWDIGNKSFTNVKEVFVKGSNGKNIRLSEGVVGTLVGKNGDIIPKHDCAAGLTPDLIISIKDLQAWTPFNHYSSSGAYQTGYQTQVDQWRLYLNHNVLRISTKKWAVINEGYLSVLQICRQ
jgi:type II secretory pathway pseudopilin PulG